MKGSAIEQMKQSPEGAAPAVLTVGEACTYLRLSRATVYNLIRAGKLTHARLGKCIRLRREDLEKYIADRINREG
jgi:excisionase family DNA binding protein